MDVERRKGLQDLTFVDSGLCRRAIERFEQAHEAEYGHYGEGEEPEITGVRLVTSSSIVKPRFSAGLSAKRTAASTSKRRTANLGPGFAPTAIAGGRCLDVMPMTCNVS